MEELINYYHSLLIIQYFSGRKARATIDSMTNLLWANQLLKQIRDSFELGSATLDTSNAKRIIAKYNYVDFDKFSSMFTEGGYYTFKATDNGWLLLNTNEIIQNSDLSTYYGIQWVGGVSAGDSITVKYIPQTAKGTQLDIIGLWVGVDRYIYQKPYDNHPWLSLIEISGAITTDWQGGYSTPSTFDTLGGFLTPDLVVGGNYTELLDEQFRTLIKLKIIKNSISHTCKNIDDAIYGLFGNKVITKWDTTNHILYYEHDRDYAPSFLLKVAEKKNALPCPTACRVFVREKQT